MKKYKFEFDYKFFDCLLLAGQCLLVSLVSVLAFSFLGGLILGAFLSDMIALNLIMIVGYIFPFVYSIIAIARYLIEGVTIKEIE
jgi:hypothetical protein|nr:MAG TPA: hypothetical protein [Siphoviridae sp. ct8IY7]